MKFMYISFRIFFIWLEIIYWNKGSFFFVGVWSEGIVGEIGVRGVLY